MNCFNLRDQNPDYSESSFVEQPAIVLCAELGWETAKSFYETYGANGGLGCGTSINLGIEDLGMSTGGQNV